MQIIASGESERVALRATAPKPATIGKTVCAFLNASGGTLIVGVSSTGQLRGVKRATELSETIQRDLMTNISPNAAWSVNIDDVEGKQMIVLDVPQGEEKPYIYDTNIFIRRGTKTVEAIGADISSLIDQRRAQGTRWERLPALGFEIGDFDEEEILMAGREAQEKRLHRIEEINNPLGIMEQLNLASRGMILNSAVALFARNPARRFPQTRVRVARFKGENLTSFVDNRTFEGHAFALIEKIESFLLMHIRIESELPKRGLKRSDAPVYPWPALREAMLNAIVHRDYAAFTGGMSVAIHDDRIEFWNSGSLPEGITVENLKGPHPSRPVNPDIANVFFLRGLIERWGIGTRLIVRECRQANLPGPQWKTDGGGVTLTIRLRPERKKLEIDLNLRQRELLNRLKPGDRLNPREYYEAVAEQVKERQARVDLLALTDSGYLRREGRGPSTVYVRTQKPAP